MWAGSWKGSRSWGEPPHQAGVGRTKSACPSKTWQELCFALASSRRLWTKFPPRILITHRGCGKGESWGRGGSHRGAHLPGWPDSVRAGPAVGEQTLSVPINSRNSPTSRSRAFKKPGALQLIPGAASALGDSLNQHRKEGPRGFSRSWRIPITGTKRGKAPVSVRQWIRRKQGWNEVERH